jgi:hypothetical protein
MRRDDLVLSPPVIRFRLDFDRPIRFSACTRLPRFDIRMQRRFLIDQEHRQDDATRPGCGLQEVADFKSVNRAAER